VREYGTSSSRRIAIGLSCLGIALVAASQLRRRPLRGFLKGRRSQVHEAITINRPLGEVYRAWRSADRPTFISPEIEITGEREHEWIAWRSVEASEVEQSGTVRFEHAPGGRGTEVHVEVFGAAARQQLREELRRLKQLLETGEVPVSDGPGLWRPAQPPERPEELKKRAGVL
jgi:uncharacterized membrane protein